MTTTATITESALLTIDEAAAYLSIPKATLYTWRTRRAGYGPPAVKMGGCLRYRRSDLDAWVEAHVEHHELTQVPAPHPGRVSLSRAGVSLSRISRPR